MTYCGNPAMFLLKKGSGNVYEEICKTADAHHVYRYSGINIESGGIKNFCDTYGLGYASKEDAIAAASTMSCPEGLA